MDKRPLFFFRCDKLEEMLNTIELYTRLASSHIEGIEVISNRFQILVTTMRKKPYDFLDQRKSEFDIDFEEFKRLTKDILVSLQLATTHEYHPVLINKEPY